MTWNLRPFSPKVICHPSEFAQNLLGLQQGESGPEVYNLTSPLELRLFKSYVARSNAYDSLLAELCAKRTGDFLKYMHTANVARDLELLSSQIEGVDTPVYVCYMLPSFVFMGV